MSEFFIRRPIVAMVISIVMVLLGLAVLAGLPIEQYPRLAPPTVRVQATYPGASAETVEQSVATPIEQQVNGVDNMLYMKSTNTSDGRLTLDVTFEVGTDLDTANVLTQNRVSLAQPRLSSEVVAQGVSVKKLNPSILSVISLYSPGGSYDSEFLNNYAMINVRDALLRVPGMAQVDLLGGAEYSMRIWLNPDTLAKLALTPTDVVNAIREQNLQAPAGKIGDAPSPPDQQFTYTVRAPGRFTAPEEFADILLRTTADGRQVRVRDVGRVQLGSENYRSFARTNGKPAAALGLYLLPGANQIVSARAVDKALGEAKKFFPNDLDYKIVYDTTPAVVASIEEIVHTLFEAVVLVLLVVLLFLQNWRATLIPMLTVPVSLIGTFIFFPLLGFTVNTLTMFGLVLAIGIVVDDAIVVVEAVMHHIEHGLSPKEATRQAMKEVSGPVIGIALVLSAVFVPVALLGGLTGMFYQQFALTIAISVLISAFNALSLSPALAALLLKPHMEHKGLIGRFFGGFNRGFERTTNGYLRIAGGLMRKVSLALLILAVLAAAGGWIGKGLPTGLVPPEDQGIVLANVQLPNAASLGRADEVLRQVEKVISETPGVESFTTVGGLGFLTNSYQPNFGSLFIRLKDWGERTTPETSLRGIIGHLQRELSRIPGAVAFPFLPPTIPGFGASGGFNFLIQDRSGSMTVEQLGEHTQRFLAAAQQRPELRNVFTSFDSRYPQVAVELDREKARKLGVPINDVFTALQITLGGGYVNDFNRFGRLYRVYLQSEADFRQRPEDIGRIYVKSQSTNDMVPLSTLVTVSRGTGTEITNRFNLYRSVEFTGASAPGYSSGQALTALEEVAKEVLPRDIGYAYSAVSYQEKTAPSPIPTFVLAVVFVFLLLAAMYESWSLPVAVLLGTPLVVFGSFAGVKLVGLENNIFVQVGLIMLVGLAAKNSILIVEFAKMKSEEGLAALDAAREAAKLRFRPILMTAFAFLLGVLPLILASGSGAASRIMMGVAVFSGMAVATFFGVFLTPAFYVFVKRWSRDEGKPKNEAPAHATGRLGEKH